MYILIRVLRDENSISCEPTTQPETSNSIENQPETSQEIFTNPQPDMILKFFNSKAEKN